MPAQAQKTYTVVAGDTLWKISQGFGITVDALEAANLQLKGSTNIKPGQVLEIPAGPSRGGLSSDQSDALGIHNAARHAAKGVSRPALIWDSHLADAATEYAEELVKANKGLKHSGVQGQGENLFWSSGAGTLSSAAQAWVNEESKYTGQKIPEGDFGSYGHYTQVIWPTTTNVGMGMAKTGKGETFIVGRYTPQGNWMGKDAYHG